MDREIPIEEQKREQRKKMLRIVGAFVAVAAVIAIVVMLLGSSIEADSLLIKPAETGTIESSVSASGKIVPLYEQAIVSPVSTKIMEVYRHKAAYSLRTGEDGVTRFRIGLRKY